MPTTMGTKWVVKDLRGLTFGRLKIVDQYPVRHRNGNARWVVECACGTIKIVRSCHLLRGTTTSCGCWNEEKRHLKAFSRATFVEHMFTRYHNGAKARDVRWDLTREQVDELLSGNCFYCGVEPLFRSKMRGSIGAFCFNGIDRMVNALGYFPENCVSCCGICNVAKQDMSLHQFATWVERLKANFRVGG
jgi:hypothetical protein